MNQFNYSCEWPSCGRQADNEITYRDPEAYEVYYTMRCEQHTILDEDERLVGEVNNLDVEADRAQFEYYERLNREN